MYIMMKTGKGIYMRELGFTLGELLLVVTILFVLIVMAVPGFSVWLPRYRVTSAARDLYSNLQLAKLTAIRQNADCNVAYTTNPDQYTICGVADPKVLSDYGSEVNFQGPGGETFDTNTITFNSRGLSNAGYAYLSNPGNIVYYRVGPLASGVIKIQKYNGSFWE